MQYCMKTLLCLISVVHRVRIERSEKEQPTSFEAVTEKGDNNYEKALSNYNATN